MRERERERGKVKVKTRQIKGKMKQSFFCGEKLFQKLTKKKRKKEREAYWAPMLEYSSMSTSFGVRVYIMK